MMTGSSSSSRTDWSMVADLSAGDDMLAADALERLIRRYWPAVYAFIRSSGFDVHEAADLTQGFIADIVLGRRLIHGADPNRGRLRHLIQTSLRNYVKEHHRHRSRRHPGRRMRRPLQLDEAQMAAAAPSGPMPPEAAFSSQWSDSLVREVLKAVAEGCAQDGLETHWAVFEARVAKPMLVGGQPVGYPELCNRLNIDEESKAANMVVTVKRRFTRALVREVGMTVTNPAEAEAELRELLGGLERGWKKG